MKKILSVLSLIAILGFATPAMATPHGGSGGPGVPSGPGMHNGGGQRVHAGAPHGSHFAPPHRHHGGGGIVYAGHPRRGYWSAYRAGYWGNYWCDYRLGWCEPYLIPTPPPTYGPHAGVYFPVGGAGVAIHF